jgi:predicted nucleotidyltransferase
MQIDLGRTIAGQPALIVRRALRTLRELVEWSTADLETAAGLGPGCGGEFARQLRREGLIERRPRGVWTVSEAGCSFAAATAARRLTRATAERIFTEFMDRVDQVNDDPYFLGKVVRVVLFGSMLNPETERPSDIDLAIEVAPKETDRGRFQQQNHARVKLLATMGHSFRNEFEMLFCWRFEIWRFLKGRSRGLSLHDYQVEKSLVLTAPHRVLIGDDEPRPMPQPPPTLEQLKPQRRSRREDDCPF